MTACFILSDRHFDLSVPLRVRADRAAGMGSEVHIRKEQHGILRSAKESRRVVASVTRKHIVHSAADHFVYIRKSLINFIVVN